MKKGILLAGTLIMSLTCSAQFWFGPKLGTQIIYPDYVSKTRLDSFKVSVRFNWHAGIAIDHSPEESMFEVHTEIMYMRVNNRIQNKTGYPDLDSKTLNHFITAPFMVRAVFMRRRQFKVIAMVGPRLSYWLGGSGSISSDETLEEGLGTVNYKVVFSNQDLSDIDIDDGSITDQHIVTKPNRIQYALDVGVGWMFDLTPTKRVIFDARFSFGHSFMAFNDGNKLTAAELYYEDTEFRPNVLMISAAYMIGYNPNLMKKGKTNSQIGKKHKRR